MAIPAEPKAAKVVSSVGTGRVVLLGLLGLFLLVAFWPILTGMYGSWFDENAFMEHGVLVAPVAAYMTWTMRAKLQQVPRKPSVVGIVLLIWGALQALLGTTAHWVFVSRFAFLISLAGFIAIGWGLPMLRALTYPLCTLSLMIAPPTFIFERLTLSLQLLASRLGEGFLDLLGYSVLREGNILELVGIKLSVEEACSGIRSLMAIVFMCICYNFFFVEGRWLRALILFMSVPIAILANAGRIVATGVASQNNPALITGTPHEMFGYISVVMAAMGCMGLHVAMVYVEKLRRARAS
jgi:exosortase